MIWFSTADGGMRQAARIERIQLVAEIRGESRAREKLVQAEFGWRRCLRNTYLFEITVDWNGTPCSLTDGTKIVSHTTKYYSLSPPWETHITFTYSLGLWNQWFHLQHDRNQLLNCVRRQSIGREVFTNCWFRIYGQCLKENTQHSWPVIGPPGPPA